VFVAWRTLLLRQGRANLSATPGRTFPCSRAKVMPFQKRARGRLRRPFRDNHHALTLSCSPTQRSYVYPVISRERTVSMKSLLAFVVLLFSFQAVAETPKPVTLRSILLEQLRTTHNEKDWFVPINVALAGLTPDQANWKDAGGNHSVGQLTYHLLFWNGRELAKFTGKSQPKFNGNNDETFNNFDAKQWSETTRQLDQVMTDLEKFVETADDQTLQK